MLSAFFHVCRLLCISPQIFVIMRMTGQLSIVFRQHPSQVRYGKTWSR